MNASTIGLIMTGLATLIIVLSVVFGIIRGFKKSLFRFIWLLVTAVILFFATPAISNLLNTIDISSLNIDIYGKVNRLSDIGVNLLNEFAKNEPVIQNSSAMQSLAENLPSIILNIFVYALSFWLLKWLLWPIWALISSRFFDKDKREEKLMKKQRKEYIESANENGEQDQNVPYVLVSHKKKKRFAGAIFGLITGLVLSIVTFCPIIGINAIYQNAYATLQTQKDGEKVSLIDSAIEDKQALEYASSYENSIINKVFTYTGVNFLSNALFDKLAVVEVEDEKVSLSQEVKMAIKVYNHYDDIANFNSENVTKESIDGVVTAVKEIFIDIEDSKILYIIGDEILPYYIGKWIDSEDFKLLDGDRFDQMLATAYKVYAEKFKLKDLKEQAESLIDVVMVLNNSDLIAPIANNQIKSLDDFAKLVGSNIKNHEDLSNTVVENMYRVDMLKDNYPQLFNESIEILFDSLNIEFVQQPANNMTLKEDFKTILTNALSFFKYYDNINNYDLGDNTAKAFMNVGTVLDVVKDDFLITDNYQNLLNYILNNINKALSSYADFSEILGDVEVVSSWKNELNAIAGTYKAVVQFINDGANIEKILNANNDKLEKIGIALDGAFRGNSKLLTNENVRKSLEIILSEVNTQGVQEIFDIEVAENTTLLSYILDNIYNDDPALTSSSKIKNWQNEIKYNLGIIRKVYPIIDENFNIQKLSSEENNQLAELGEELDIAVNHTYLVLSNDIIAKVINHYLKQVNFPTEVKNILDSQGTSDTVYNEILANISNNNENLVWEEEFSKVKSLLTINYNEGNFDLKDIGANLDDVKGSNIITDPILSDIIASYIKDHTTAWDKEGNEDLVSAREELIQNLGEIESYAVEFEHISNLISIIQNYGAELGDNIEKIGLTFNGICGFSEGTTASKVLTQPLVNKFLIYYLDDHIERILDAENDQDLIKIVEEQIESKFDEIEDYSSELSNLYHLVLCANNNYDANNDNANNLKDLGKVFDGALSRNDSSKASEILDDIVIKNLISYFIGKISETITDKGLTDIIAVIKTNVENPEMVASSYEIELGHFESLINVSTSSTLDFNATGEVFDEICNINNDPEKTKSTFITREEVLDELLKKFFYDFVTANLSDGDLKTAVDKIVTDDNIKAIESYQTEFNFLEDLFGIVNSTDNSLIGQTLDAVRGNSNLINEDIINEIVVCFFKENTKSYEGGEYEDIISLIEVEIKSIKDNTDKSYKQALEELDKIVSYINEFSTLTSSEDFATASGIGEKLDEMEDMTCSCNKEITHAIANLIIKDLLTSLESLPTYKADVQQVLTEYDFDNHVNNSYEGDYYTNLINAIQNALPTA